MTMQSIELCCVARVLHVSSMINFYKKSNVFAMMSFIVGYETILVSDALTGGALGMTSSVLASNATTFSVHWCLDASG